MTQSSPTMAPSPIYTFGYISVRSPTRAPRPTDENGPIDTSRPIDASGATTLSVSTPAGGFDRRREQGERIREDQIRMLRSEHRARRGRLIFADDDSGRARTAERRRILAVREKRDVALARLIEPRDTPGSPPLRHLRAGTPTAPRAHSISLFDWRRFHSRPMCQPTGLTSCATVSRNENITRPSPRFARRISRDGAGAAPMPPRALRDRARGARARGRGAGVRDGAGAHLPPNFGQRVPGPASGKIVTDEPEPEVIGDEVRAGHQEKCAGRHKQQAVDDDPFHMAIGLPLQLGAGECSSRPRPTCRRDNGASSPTRCAGARAAAARQSSRQSSTMRDPSSARSRMADPREPASRRSNALLPRAPALP